MIPSFYRAQCLYRGLVTPDEATNIENMLCKKPINPNDAKVIFKTLKNFDDLRKFMICVLLEKMPSPLYKFDDLKDKNTDNEWWGNDAWKMLLLMNVKGLITHESEDNGAPVKAKAKKFMQDNKVVVRASVSGVMLKNNNTDNFLRYVNLKGMIAYKYSFTEEYNENQATIPRTYMNDKVAASLPTSLAKSVFTESVKNDEIEQVLLNKCVGVEIIDPNFGVPAVESLFPKILEAFALI